MGSNCRFPQLLIHVLESHRHMHMVILGEHGDWGKNGENLVKIWIFFGKIFGKI